jgi:DeoR/GlpR family transcriptional regulator of sugar metabolism
MAKEKPVMLASERRRLILERVAQRQTIEGQVLADELNVSVMTIRRDIKQLEQDGFLRQAYGGATVHITKSVELGFNSRALQCATEKRLIGADAVKDIEPGQTIFLSEGTTTAQFAQFLPPHPHLLVITASLSHASLLASRGIQVIVLGGKLHADELVMTGPLTETGIHDFYADICVLGAAGVDPEVGITESNYEVAAIHRLMLQRSSRIILLADHRKMAFRAPAVVAPLCRTNVIVTDAAVPAAMIHQLQACGPQVHIAGEQEQSRFRR